MKKFSTLFSAVLLSAMVIVFSVSCQKEQAAGSDSTAAATESARVVGTTGSGSSLSGSITSTYAGSLAANYAKKYGGSDDGQSQSVAFSAKDLIAFITALQAKNKSTDLIYVNFGVYGKGALPVNAKDYGRLTVFFTGGSSTSTTRRSNDDETGGGDALNHGGIYP